MKKIVSLMLILVIMVGFLCSCGGPDGDNESTSGATETGSLQTGMQPTKSADSEIVAATEASEVPTETQASVKLKGRYSLEDCTKSQGFFIAYEDGSFDRYRHGGYCLGLTKGAITFNGMFLADSIANSLPIISADDSLTLFCDVAYYVYVFPIHGEVATIQVTAEDGTEGFGRLSSQYYMNVYYRNHESSSVDFQTINGKSPAEYEIEKVYINVNPYKGMRSKSVNWTLNGFKRDATVTLGIAEGTTLVETTYNIDSKYYACDPEMNNWDEEDVYYPGTVATTQGYAVLDFSGLPTGTYIMVERRADGKYIATLLKWENG